MNLIQVQKGSVGRGGHEISQNPAPRSYTPARSRPLYRNSPFTIPAVAFPLSDAPRPKAARSGERPWMPLAAACDSGWPGALGRRRAHPPLHAVDPDGRASPSGATAAPATSGARRTLAGWAGPPGRVGRIKGAAACWRWRRCSLLLAEVLMRGLLPGRALRDCSCVVTPRLLRAGPRSGTHLA